MKVTLAQGYHRALLFEVAWLLHHTWKAMSSQALALMVLVYNRKNIYT